MIASRHAYFIYPIAQFCLLITSWAASWADQGLQATISTPHATVSLISNYSIIIPEQEFWIGLHFKLKPGWHIYYANPGDSGLAPKALFNEQANLAIGEISWPTPEIIPFGPLVNYGYQGEVLLPIRVVSNKSTKNGTIELTAKVTWLVCEEDCIPEKGTFTLAIEQGNSLVESDSFSLFSQSVAQLPNSPAAELLFEIQEKSDELELRLPPLLAQASNVYFFSSLKGITKASAPQSVNSSSPEQLLLHIKKAPSFKGLPQIVSGILTYTTQSGTREALNINVKGSDSLSQINILPPQNAEKDTSLMLLIVAALIGGMILNLMPCVLPVLSLKVLSLVNQAEDLRSRQFILTLSYTVGIISSLMALGGLLLVLRDQGAKIGWGFQLQYAPVIGLLALFFFVLGLSFLGFIEFGGKLANKAANLDRKEGIGGAFLSGLLATLVATPCTAPFLGTAIGVALIRPWYQALAIFASMGLGIAFPYILLVVIPRARTFLPRPGAWMITFKEFLAFPLFATSLWLLWVLCIQRGGLGVLVILIAALMLVFGLWLHKSTAVLRSFSRSILRVVAILAILLGCSMVILPDLLTTSRDEKVHQDGSVTDAHGLTWIPYSEQSLQQLRSQGKTIYLDFTAAWCITCQVNKSVVFSDQRVIEYVRNKEVILMRADWTNEDPLISKALENLGRASIPLNIVYHGLDTTPIELPTILTPSVVLESFNKNF